MSKNSPLRSYGLQLLKALLAALTVVLCSRWLGPDGRGELSILLFGLQIAMMLNEFVGGSAIGNMAVKYPSGRILPMAYSWAVLVIFVYWGYLNYYYQTHELQVNIYRMLFYALPLALLSIHYSLFQGYAMVYKRNELQLLLELLKLAGIVVIYLILDNFVPSDVIGVYGVSTVIILLLSFYFLRNFIFPWKQTGSPPVEMLHSGFWAQAGHLMLFCNYRLLLFPIESKLGIAEAGVYSNVVLIADMIWILANTFGSIAHMRILQSRNPVFHADITLRYAAISFWGTLFCCVVVILLPNGIFPFIFGKGFEAMKPVAIYFIPAVLCLGLSASFSHYFHAKNKFIAIFIVYAIALGIQWTLAQFWIDPMGLKGAALACSVAFGFILIAFLWMFYRQHPHLNLKSALHPWPGIRALKLFLTGR